jgi:hypothetical protein
VEALRVSEVARAATHTRSEAGTRAGRVVSLHTRLVAHALLTHTHTHTHTYIHTYTHTHTYTYTHTHTHIHTHTHTHT